MKCSTCGETLPPKDFYKSETKKSSGTRCKKCVCAYVREHRKPRSDYSRESNKYYRKKDQARRTGRPFTLTHDEFMKLKKTDCCHYCKKPMKVKTLDCVNIQKGYVRGNVVPSCLACNRLKSNFEIKHIPALEQILKELRKAAKKPL